MIASKAMNQKHTMSGIQVALRLEGLIVLITSLVLYERYGACWGLFALLLLAPDLAFLAYVLDREIGRHVYNLLHWYGLPLLLGIGGLLLDWPTGITLSLIWTAHIGLDQLVGYGLKYPGDNKNTHLQRT